MKLLIVAMMLNLPDREVQKRVYIAMARLYIALTYVII
jgi:hypothetical protein